MRILLVHNHYRQAGGEDSVFASQCRLLRQAGHDVRTYVRDSRREIPSDLGSVKKLELFATAIWSRKSAADLHSLLDSWRPDVAHFHNTFPLISPAAYYACQRADVPVVQTLHNFRLICANALLSRDGSPCVDCVGRILPLPAIRYSCYQGSRTASIGVASIVGLHRLIGTWHRNVALYMALSEFSRTKFIEGGLPASKLRVVPNFVHPDPLPGNGDGGYALFAGRISAEKGLSTLLSAWQMASSRPRRLKIVGEGPDELRLRSRSKPTDSIDWLGQRSHPEVLELMRRAEFLVLPSTVYENFPMTLVEAMGASLPAIVTGHGALKEIVEHEVTGLHAMPENAEDLANQIGRISSRPGWRRALGARARQRFEQSYTSKHHLARLLEVYSEAIATGANRNERTEPQSA